MADSSGIEALRRAILQDAEEMARSEIEQAQRLSAEERERAGKEAEAESSRILREAEREAEALRRRTASGAELEAKRRMLEVRERLIREVLDRALAALREGAGAESRRSSVARLILEAAREAGGGKLVVQTSAGDARLLTRDFLEGIRDALAREGISAELEPADRTADIAGGAIVTGADGRIVVDNSFEARLKRQEGDLRATIWRILSREPGG